MPTANLGRVGFVNKGVWSDGLHKINDLVSFGTGKYACILQHTSTLGDITPTNTTYWEKWTDYGTHNVTNISNSVIASADSQYLNYFTGTAGLSTGYLSIKITGLAAATAASVDLGFMEITITQDDRDHSSATNPASYKFMIKGNMDSGVWYNTNAVLLGTTSTTPINVRFTRTAVDAYIEIGDIGSNWYYPTVEVAHVSSYIIAGYTPIFLATIQASLLGTTTDSIIAVTGQNIAGYIHSSTAKTILADADEIAILDSSSSFVLGKITNSNLKLALTDNSVQDFRLTLSSGTPVTINDVTSATTIYFAPYKGNKLSLYNGASWDLITSAQISISVPATTSQMYDVFVYNNVGVATLELTAWTNDTTRATALVYQDGVLCKTGALTRRYVGSFRTTTVSGQTEDSAVKRYVWNYYNRVQRLMFRQDSTASWTYTTATYRQANNAAANQLDFVVGISEDTVSASTTIEFSNTSAGIVCYTAIGLDSTTTPSSIPAAAASSTAANSNYMASSYIGYAPVGRHTLVWLEKSSAAGTTTWYGAARSGLQGELLG